MPAPEAGKTDVLEKAIAKMAKDAAAGKKPEGEKRPRSKKPTKGNEGQVAETNLKPERSPRPPEDHKKIEELQKAILALAEDGQHPYASKLADVVVDIKNEEMLKQIKQAAELEPASLQEDPDLGSKLVEDITQMATISMEETGEMEDGIVAAKVAARVVSLHQDKPEVVKKQTEAVATMVAKAPEPVQSELVQRIAVEVKKQVDNGGLKEAVATTIIEQVAISVPDKMKPIVQAAYESGEVATSQASMPTETLNDPLPKDDMVRESKAGYAGEVIKPEPAESATVFVAQAKGDEANKPIDSEARSSEIPSEEARVIEKAKSDFAEAITANSQNEIAVAVQDLHYEVLDGVVSEKAFNETIFATAQEAVPQARTEIADLQQSIATGTSEDVKEKLHNLQEKTIGASEADALLLHVEAAAMKKLDPTQVEAIDAVVNTAVHQEALPQKVQQTFATEYDAAVVLDNETRMNFLARATRVETPGAAKEVDVLVQTVAVAEVRQVTVDVLSQNIDKAAQNLKQAISSKKTTGLVSLFDQSVRSTAMQRLREVRPDAPELQMAAAGATSGLDQDWKDFYTAADLERTMIEAQYKGKTRLTEDEKKYKRLGEILERCQDWLNDPNLHLGTDVDYIQKIRSNLLFNGLSEAKPFLVKLQTKLDILEANQQMQRTRPERGMLPGEIDKSFIDSLNPSDTSSQSIKDIFKGARYLLSTSQIPEIALENTILMLERYDDPEVKGHVERLKTKLNEIRKESHDYFKNMNDEDFNTMVLPESERDELIRDSEELYERYQETMEKTTVALAPSEISSGVQRRHGMYGEYVLYLATADRPKIVEDHLSKMRTQLVDAGIINDEINQKIEAERLRIKTMYQELAKKMRLRSTALHAYMVKKTYGDANEMAKILAAFGESGKNYLLQEHNGQVQVAQNVLLHKMSSLLIRDETNYQISYDPEMIQKTYDLAYEEMYFQGKTIYLEKYKVMFERYYRGKHNESFEQRYVKEHNASDVADTDVYKKSLNEAYEKELDTYIRNKTASSMRLAIEVSELTMEQEVRMMMGLSPADASYRPHAPGPMAQTHLNSYLKGLSMMNHDILVWNKLPENSVGRLVLENSAVLAAHSRGLERKVRRVMNQAMRDRPAYAAFIKDKEAIQNDTSLTDAEKKAKLFQKEYDMRHNKYRNLLMTAFGADIEEEVDLSGKKTGREVRRVGETTRSNIDKFLKSEKQRDEFAIQHTKDTLQWMLGKINPSLGPSKNAEDKLMSGLLERRLLIVEGLKHLDIANAAYTNYDVGSRVNIYLNQLETMYEYGNNLGLGMRLWKAGYNYYYARASNEHQAGKIKESELKPQLKTTGDYVPYAPLQYLVAGHNEATYTWYQSNFVDFSAKLNSGGPSDKLSSQESPYQLYRYLARRSVAITSVFNEEGIEPINYATATLATLTDRQKKVVERVTRAMNTEPAAYMEMMNEVSKYVTEDHQLETLTEEDYVLMYGIHTSFMEDARMGQLDAPDLRKVKGVRSDLEPNTKPVSVQMMGTHGGRDMLARAHADLGRFQTDVLPIFAESLGADPKAFFESLKKIHDAIVNASGHDKASVSDVYYLGGYMRARKTSRIFEIMFLGDTSKGSQAKRVGGERYDSWSLNEMHEVLQEADFALKMKIKGFVPELYHQLEAEINLLYEFKSGNIDIKTKISQLGLSRMKLFVAAALILFFIQAGKDSVQVLSGQQSN